MKPVFKRGPPNQPGWELRGRVHNAFEIGSRRIRFEGAEQLIQGTRFSPKSLLFHSHIPLQRVVVLTDSEQGSAWVKPRENLTDFEVLVLPSDSLTVGPFNFDITIHGMTPSNRKLPGIAVTVSGMVSPEFQAFPSLVQFGAHSVGTKAEELVTLRSLSGVEFNIDNALTDSDRLSVAPSSVASLATQHTFRVSADFQDVGETKGSVQFHIRDDNNQLHEIVVRASGYAFDPKDRAF
jgi:hypothetical protein